MQVMVDRARSVAPILTVGNIIDPNSTIATFPLPCGTNVHLCTYREGLAVHRWGRQWTSYR